MQIARSAEAVRTVSCQREVRITRQYLQNAIIYKRTMLQDIPAPSRDAHDSSFLCVHYFRNFLLLSLSCSLVLQMNLKVY